MAAKGDPVERAEHELYGLPPGEFTRARDERVRELRQSGDRAAADAVKALRKPTVAAWALNQLSRERGKELDRLLSAGAELRAAQEQLLAGGERSAFQSAAATERDLVAELTAAARRIASDAGERAAGLDEKVSGTLHAAALDEETAEELRAGRLTREREAIAGFGGSLGELAAIGARHAPRAPKAREAKAARAASKRGAASKKAAEAARRRERLAGARSDERHARRELQAAEKALRSARARAAAAEAHAADAVERAKVASERLKEAQRAHSAAKRSHARAERSLKSAEGG